MVLKKERLINGIPVLMVPMRNYRSVATGIWVKSGSRYEPEEKNGISHFIEHMFFKGTTKRTQKEIAIEVDSLGGELNAFTSKETTTFYIKVLDQFLEKGLELLSDIYTNSTFPEEEIEKEKLIIKEEIKLVEDTPDDYIHDLFYETVWDRSGLGQPILGRRETIKRFTRDSLLEYKKRFYGIEEIVISCAGNFNPETILPYLNKYFGNINEGSTPHAITKPEFHRRTNIIKKDLSEVHICIGVEAFELSNPKRYHLALLNAILGGGISSRLFQEVREKRGLAYSIYSFVSLYRDIGVWGVYAGTSKKRYEEVIDIIKKEMLNLSETITDDEFKRAKDQLKGNLILGLESTGNMMNHIARQEIYYKRHLSQEEIIKQIDRITIKEIKDVLKNLLYDKDVFSMALLGPVK